MHSSSIPSDQETPENKKLPQRNSTIQSLIFATALAMNGCVSLPPSTESVDDEICSELQLENPSFIALLGICAEIQVGINLDTDNQYTLEYIWQTVKNELEKIIITKDVSISLIAPQKTERGYAYIAISITDQQGNTWDNAIYARNKAGAEEKIQSLRDNYMLYLKEKLEYMQPKGQKIDIQIIRDVFETEKLGLKKHRMRHEVIEDGKNWTIVLHYEDSNEFGIFCLANDVNLETPYFGE